jgi:hypothetical protein
VSKNNLKIIIIFIYKMSSDKIKQMQIVHNEATEIFKKKSISYEDTFADYGTTGVIVRIGDKIQRLVSITNRGINLTNTKLIRDTLIDLHNYAAMAVISIDENNTKNIVWGNQTNQNFELKIENLC